MKVNLTLRRVILALLAASIILLSSCGGNGGNKTEPSEKTPQEEQSAGKSEENGGNNSMPDFPHEIKTFDGETFTILVEDEPMNFLEITDYDIEEEPGDVLNSAIYQRNIIVEDTFKIKLQSVHTENVRTMVTKTIKSGMNDYDAVALRLANAAPMAMAGECINLNGLSSLSLDMPWWDQNILKDMSIGGNSYLIAGDIFTKHYDAIAMMFFNKKLLTDYNVENPYKLVEENQWTIDKFSELTKGITKDLDGNGVIDYLDLFGLSTQADFLTSMINGSGAKFIEKNNNDIPYFAGASEKINTIIDKVLGFYIDDTYCLHRDAYAKNVTSDKMLQFLVFPQGKSLFFWGLPRYLDLELRSMEDDFGMLPIPKYDSSQERYYATANTWHSYAYTIPQSAADPEKTAYIMDAMAYYGRIHILPAYYDVCLTRKYTRDEESSAMLDIIFNSSVYDIGDIYNLGNYRLNLENMLQKNTNNIMSEYEKSSAKIEKDLDKLITQFEKNAE